MYRILLQVLAVDQSDIYSQAIDIIRENDLDHVIQVIHGKLEEIELPVDKVGESLFTT